MHISSLKRFVGMIFDYHPGVFICLGIVSGSHQDTLGIILLMLCSNKLYLYQGFLPFVQTAAEQQQKHGRRRKKNILSVTVSTLKSINVLCQKQHG